MSNLKAVLKQTLIEAAVAYGTRNDYGKKFAGAGVLFLSGYIIITAIIVLGNALSLRLEPQYGDEDSELLAGLFFVAVSSLMSYGGLKIMSRGNNQKVQEIREQAKQVATLISEDMLEDMRRPVYENPKTAVALAAIAGFLAGGRLK